MKLKKVIKSIRKLNGRLVPSQLDGFGQADSLCLHAAPAPDDGELYIWISFLKEDIWDGPISDYDGEVVEQGLRDLLSRVSGLWFLVAGPLIK